ncbi:30S ribosomal protein S20 [Blattabacterium cuenoti]|uniref:30S ribosomal protein S20 n=1 Tax=Blattabacterium cuenoti TaxID=1653831 RepID=UPI00163D07CF|nr:30S ribosomal protein S20 [Blattabacterium cuenoti]
MANHLSSLKRIRQNQVKRLRNRYVYKSTKTAIKKFLNNDDKNEKDYSKVISMIDKLVKKNIIHKNKSSRLKNRLSKNLLSK